VRNAENKVLLGADCLSNCRLAASMLFRFQLNALRLCPLKDAAQLVKGIMMNIIWGRIVQLY
jgi:hypothetical protein